MNDIAVIIPSSTEVNYTDGQAIVGYARLLISTIQTEGGLSYPCPVSRQLNSLITEARQWIILVERNISNLDIIHIPDVIQMFDLIYRLAHQRPAPQAFIDSWNERVYQSWLHGDKRIHEADILRIIGDAMTISPTKVAPNRMRWYFATSAKAIDDILDDALPILDALRLTTTLLKPGSPIQKVASATDLHLLAHKFIPQLTDPAGLPPATVKYLTNLLTTLWPTYIDRPTFDTLSRTLLS